MRGDAVGPWREALFFAQHDPMRDDPTQHDPIENGPTQHGSLVSSVQYRDGERGRMREDAGCVSRRRGLLHLNVRASTLKVNQSPRAGRRCRVRDIVPERISRCELTPLLAGEDQDWRVPTR